MESLVAAICNLHCTDPEEWMSDIAQRTESTDGGHRFLKNLAYLVPGYRGYKDKSLRREEDARLRNRVLGKLAEFHEWNEPEEILRLATLVAVARDGVVPDGLGVDFVPLTIPRLDISSSEIRTRIRAGRSARSVRRGHPPYR